MTATSDHPAERLLPPESEPVKKQTRRFVFTCVFLVLSVTSAGLIFALVQGSRVNDQGLNHYVPKGYQRQVLSMLERPQSQDLPMGQTGPLQYQMNTGGVDEFRPEWGSMIFDDSMANPGQRRFFQLSNRLRQDIAMFNETGDGFFQVDWKGVINVAPYYHNFALPYPEPAPFQGQLSLGGELLPSLIGDGLYLGFARLDKGAEAEAGEIKILGPSQWSQPSKQPRQYRAPAYELMGAGVPILRFAMTGNHIQMELLDTVEPVETAIYLNGDRVNRPGPAAAAFLQRVRELPKNQPRITNAAPLKQGDRLRIVNQKSGSIITLRFGQYRGGLVTRNWTENGRIVTEIDPELARVLPYVQDLQQALNRYVQAHPNPGSLGKPNFRLTIDRDLHTSISNVFLPFVRNFDARIAALPDTLAEPACITVVNALNGDVLALPSYPAPEDLEVLAARMRSKSLPDVNPDILKRLARNQNLLAIPIGSTTKPLLASAIWETHPELRTLTVDENGAERTDIYGLKLIRTYRTVPRGRVTPESFLKVSSNDYTIHLGMLMLAREAKLDRAGQPIFPNGRADYSQYLQGDLIVGGLVRSSLTAFPKLAECYGINLVRSLEDNAASSWDRELLEPMFQQLGADGKLLYDSFSGVIPEKTNLDLASINSVRGKYISLLLGSRTNRWSNLLLAQAYARLGSGRLIHAHLVRDPDTEPKFESFARLPVSDEVLAMVHDGMSGAVSNSPGATAAAIADNLRKAREQLAGKGLQLFAIGKTGTAMRVNRQNSKDKRDHECAAFCLYLEIRDRKDRPLAATSTAVYLQDRAATRSGARNSGVAVQLTEEILPHILAWMQAQPKVKAAVQ